MVWLMSGSESFSAFLARLGKLDELVRRPLLCGNVRAFVRETYP
jgi:hypothetical protein